ncbi:MAG: AAA family ATPase [Candidatus Omnitrophica bacterium]|nr:AAA family ATPase [Candidatus Omnitrophota bacterium]
MELITRTLKIDLPARQSAFLWGPRKTGKTTLLKQTFPEALTFDLLNTDLCFTLIKSPWLLREQLLASPPALLKQPVIIDEIQKVPALLDEVHKMIEEQGLRFILCGSSTRKLKRGCGNLLGGRAWRFELFPLTSQEVGKINLLKICNNGLVPAHYLQEDAARSLTAYVRDYLKEEVFNEGLTRNIPAFSRFFDAMAYSQGELLNYANIARDCGVDAKTVREYYQILVDTLVGQFVEPFKKRQDRGVILRAPKFYLFDVGVAGAIAGRRVLEERGEAFGKALEHFILMEITAYRAYCEKNFTINFWRTKTGLEVDFVLGAGAVAVEVKGTSRIDRRDLRPIQSFIEAYRPQRAFVISNEKASRSVDGVLIQPWREFLKHLWQGEVI